MSEGQLAKYRGGSNLRGSEAAQDHKLEVLCACDDRYVPHAGTMLCSLLEHNKIHRVHLFYSSIRGSELAKLNSLVSGYGSELSLYDVSPADFKDLLVDKWASIAVYYRLLAPRILPRDMQKVLYLDSDIIVRGPLRPLWDIDMTGHALAAVVDHDQEAGMVLGLPAGAPYFNSGVLLINLQFWRQNDVAERAISFVRNNPQKVRYWDQDGLNATLFGRWIVLPSIWNWQESCVPSGCGEEPIIAHFISSAKPWQWYGEHAFKHEYRKYRLKTPWRRYRPEGQPNWPLRVVRSVLPAHLRKWLRRQVARRATLTNG